MWLVRNLIQNFAKSKLPSKKDVLALFGYYHFTLKHTINVSAKEVAAKIVQLWNCFHIPTQEVHKISKKVIILFNSWRGLKKNKENKKKQSATLERNRAVFVADIQNLFDISHAKAFDKIMNPSIKTFLIGSQKKCKKMSKASLLKLKKDRTSLLSREVSSTNIETGSLTSSQSSEMLSENDNDTHFTGPELKKTSENLNIKIMNKELVPILDRSKLSNRKAAAILPSVAKSLGHNTKNMTISYSTVRRVRQKGRKEVADEIRNSVRLEPPLTVHWDSKLLPLNSSNY